MAYKKSYLQEMKEQRAALEKIIADLRAQQKVHLDFYIGQRIMLDDAITDFLNDKAA